MKVIERLTAAKCDFVLRRWPSPPHETTLANWNPSRAPARSALVCLAADEIRYSNFSSYPAGDRFALVPTRHRLGLSSALRRIY